MEVPSLMLDSKPEDSEAFNYSTYRHASYDGLIEQRSGRYHSLSLDDDSLSAQEALYTSAYVRSQRTRRSSSQADSILHALTPPSHALKARRFSKNNEAGVGMSRKRSLVSEYQKEFSNHSAVSPRFMTLRKLSEVTTVSPHTIYDWLFTYNSCLVTVILMLKKYHLYLKYLLISPRLLLHPWFPSHLPHLPLTRLFMVPSQTRTRCIIFGPTTNAPGKNSETKHSDSPKTLWAVLKKTCSKDWLLWKAFNPKV